MPQVAAKTEERRNIEASPELQKKNARFAPPPEFAEKEENKGNVIIQTEDDKLRIEGENEEQRLLREREQVKTQQEGKQATVERTIKRENPYEKRKREAEENAREAGEYKTKYEQSTEAQKALETQLQEARTKLEEAGSNADIKAAQSEIANLKDQIADVTKKSGEYTKKLESRVEFYNLVESPRFQREFVAPCIEAYNEVNTFVGEEPEARQILAQALGANQNALGASSPAEAKHYENVRDQMFSKLMEDMPAFSKDRFVATLNDFIRRTEKQAKALKDWEKVKPQLIEEGNREAREAQVKHREYWDGLYKETETEVDAMIPVNDELEKVIKENNIPYNLEHDAVLSKALMTDAKVPEREVTRILNQGRAFSRAVAYAKALEIQNKEQATLIAKLKGGDPGNLGDRGGLEERRSDGLTLSEKNKKFARMPGQ